MVKRSKYLYADRDRHGNTRYYFKPPGRSKVRIKHAEGTREFKAEYRRLWQAWEAGDDLAPQTRRIQANTLEWLFKQYIGSRAFGELAKNTQIQRRNMMDRTAKVYGDKPIQAMTPVAFARIRDTFTSPGAARNWIKAMRAVFKWAAEMKLIPENPTANVTIPRTPNKGAERWTLAEIGQYMDHHPQGSPARVCMAILLCTGQRISDARVIGRANVQNGWLTITQQKTKATVRLPILPLLRQELGQSFLDLVWLQSAQGAPYSEKSLSQRFSAWAKAAGINKTAHGVRKSVGSLLAEAGLSEDTIMAVLGHDTSEEARKYIQDANRDKLAAQAMDTRSQRFKAL